MSRITFTRDGALVRGPGGLQRDADREDPLALLRWLPERVEVEAGVTVRQLVRALEPWERVVSALSEVGLARWIEIAARHPTHLAQSRATRVVIDPVVVVSRGGPGRRDRSTFAPRWRALAVAREGAPAEPLGDHEPSFWLDSPVEIRREIHLLDIPATFTGEPSLPWLAERETPIELLAVPTFMATLLVGLIDDALTGRTA